MTTQSSIFPKDNSNIYSKTKPAKASFQDDLYSGDTPALEKRPQLAPRYLLRSEDVSIVEVRQRSQQMVWTVECRGEHYETSLRVLKRTAPQAVIEFLVANLRV
jgi:hypothetical protein